MPEVVLDIRRLSVRYSTRNGSVRGIADLSLGLASGERLALIGESGCGKTTLAQAIMGLLPCPGSYLSGESLSLGGQELIELPERCHRRLRGRTVAIIPQCSTNALNPVQSIGRQMETVIMRRLGISRRQARLEASAVLGQLDFGDPDTLLRRYPHQLSGGICQRVVIALAIACRPRLLISDEGTSALDPTTRAGTLDRLSDLSHQNGTALLMITHDFGIVAGHCRRVAVMYQGQVVEQAPIDAIFERPRHPYTAALLAAVPSLSGAPDRRLNTIPEAAAESALDGPSAGCRFAPRCPRVQSLCRRENPELSDDRTDDRAGQGGHSYRCHFPLD